MKNRNFILAVGLFLCLVVSACDRSPQTNSSSSATANAQNRNENFAQNKTSGSQPAAGVSSEIGGAVNGQMASENGALNSTVKNTNVPSNSSAKETGAKTEERCGWFENPTPGNAWLNDKDGEWLIGAQGGYQAEGDYPDIPDEQWVKTNINYGYGCACLRVTVDRAKKRIVKIVSSTAKPLAVCRKDKALKEPAE